MSDVSRAKTRRASARGKITKLLKNIDKLLSDNGRELRPDELQRKLSQSNAAITEEQEAQEHLLEQMAVEGSTEEEIQKEVDGNLTIEATYDERIDEITEAIHMSTQLLRYQELITQAETWLDYSAPSSTEFSSTGNKIVEGIREGICHLYKICGRSCNQGKV